MEKSDRTKQCIKRRNIFFAISTLMWIGTVLTIIILVLAKFNATTVSSSGESISIITQEAKDKIVAFGLSAFVALILALFVKEKVRTAVYMLSLVIAVILKGEGAMYVVLTIWALDEYVFYALYKSYKAKVTINKEIDRR